MILHDAIDTAVGVVALAGALYAPVRKLNQHLSGLRDQIGDVKKDVDKVRGMVFNNGGGSLKDAVDRIETRQAAIVDHLLQIDSDRAGKEKAWNEWATKISPNVTPPPSLPVQPPISLLVQVNTP